MLSSFSCSSSSGLCFCLFSCRPSSSLSNKLNKTNEQISNSNKKKTKQKQIQTKLDDRNWNVKYCRVCYFVCMRFWQLKLLQLIRPFWVLYSRLKQQKQQRQWQEQEQLLRLIMITSGNIISNKKFTHTLAKATATNYISNRTLLFVCFVFVIIVML